MNDKERAQQLIKELNIELAGINKMAVPKGDRLTNEQKSELRRLKPEIIATIKEENLKKWEEAGKEREAKKQAEDEFVRKSGVELYWHQGSPLSGWTAFDASERALARAGIGKDVGGWGYYISPQEAMQLGLGRSANRGISIGREMRGVVINYEVVAGIINKKHAIEVDKAHKNALNENEIRDEATKQGVAKLLQTQIAECTDPGEECSTDRVETWAMPDGSIQTIRRHMW